MNTIQEMEQLAKVERVVRTAKKSIQYEFENRIDIVVGFPDEAGQSAVYLSLTDHKPEYCKAQPQYAAMQKCKDAIVAALNEYHLELARIIRKDFDEYVDAFDDPQGPEVDNEAPLCECGEPTCNGTCYPIQLDVKCQ